jgi:hypothetical protein
MVLGYTLSAVQVQTIAAAAAALQYGANRNELRVLSELGARGQWPGNVRRDLLRSLRLEVSVPQATTFELPIQDKYGELDWAEAPVLLPPELCRVIFHDHREHFNFLTSGLAHFWNQIRADDPKLIGHPMHQKLRWKERAIPLVVHGDSAQFV